MAQEVFVNIVDAMRDSMRHVTNTSPATLIFAAGGIALVAYFLLRNR